MKLTLPIWSCEQIKTNRIYCKHFLNHVLGGQKKLPTPHVYSTLECFCKVDLLLNRRCQCYIFTRDSAVCAFNNTIDVMYPLTACSLPWPSLPTGIIKGALSDMCAQLVGITKTWQTSSSSMSPAQDTTLTTSRPGCHESHFQTHIRDAMCPITESYDRIPVKRVILKTRLIRRQK